MSCGVANGGFILRGRPYRREFPCPENSWNVRVASTHPQITIRQFLFSITGKLRLSSFSDEFDHNLRQ